MGCNIKKRHMGREKLHCFSFLESVLDEEVPDSEKNTGKKHWEKPDSDSLDVMQIYIKDGNAGRNRNRDGDTVSL